MENKILMRIIKGKTFIKVNKYNNKVQGDSKYSQDNLRKKKKFLKIMNKIIIISRSFKAKMTKLNLFLILLFLVKISKFYHK